MALGVPLVIVGLLAYSCSSPSPVTNAKAASSPSPHPSTSQSKLITPGPQVSGTVAPPNSYPVTGPTGSSSASGGGGGNGGAGSLSGAGAGCVLTVSVVTNETAANGVPQYPSGQDPIINVTLQNKGTANCLIPAGGVVVTVRSINSTGSQQIVWNSSACQSTSGSEMAIGSNPVTVPIPWQRIDNASSCPGTSAAASGQLYEATASALGVTSTPAQFELD